MASTHGTAVDLLRRWQAKLAEGSGDYLSLSPDPDAILTIAQPEPAAIFESLVKRQQAFRFWLPADGAATAPGFLDLVCAEIDRQAILRKLARLQKIQKDQAPERSAIALAFGLLNWQDQAGTAYRTPLVLLPVSIRDENAGKTFGLASAGSGPELNPALRWRQDLQAELPAVPETWEHHSLTDYFHDLSARLSPHKGFRIEPATHLVSLPVFREAALKDLEEHGQQITGHPIIRVFSGEATAQTLLPAPVPTDDELDSVQLPQITYLVLDADSSQRRCIEAAARGISFILVGAAGTGKRQTIINLVADALARGKNVLVAGQSNAALEDLACRLERVGLADLAAPICRSSKSTPRPAPCGPTAPDHEEPRRLQKCRDHLTGYVRSLHASREPLKKSVWWALNELVRLRDCPSLPLGLAHDRSEPSASEHVPLIREVTPAWLEEVRQAIARMQQVWKVHDQADLPWRGFKADRYSKQVREAALGLLERVKTRVDHYLAAAEQYGNRLGCKGPVAWLLKVGELLESSPGRIPANWLQCDDLKGLNDELEICAAEYQRLGLARAPLSQRYGPGIWQVPDGAAAQATDAWQTVAPLVVTGDANGVSWLTRQQALRGWAADTQKRIPGWIAEAHTLEKWLGIPIPTGAVGEVVPGKTDPSPLLLRQLQRLANLCMSDKAPERTWVHDPKLLPEVRRLIDACKPRFTDYHRRRRQLLEMYTESVFELELERMATAFSGPYQSWLRILNGQYRRDCRIIRRRTHAVALPQTVAQDLTVARDLLKERQQLEGEQPTRKQLLGRYENGLETDFDGADRAQRTAVEALDLAHKLGCNSLPPRFVDVLCAGTPPAEKIQAAAKRLHDSLGAWLHLTDELKRFLPMESLPGVGRPLEQCAVSVLTHYARDLQTSLNRFGSVTDVVLAKAVQPPADATVLVADLQQAEEIRKSEATQETQRSRWQSEFGPGFQGLATDWNALRKGLAWSQRVRDHFQGRPPDRFVQLATTQGGQAPAARELRASQEQYAQGLHGLEVRFDAPGPTLDGKRLAEHPPEVVRQRLDLMRQRVDELAEWIEWRSLPTRFEHLGLRGFWEAVNREAPPLETMHDVFMKSFARAWADTILEQDSALGKFRRDEHEQVLREFQERERGWIEANRQRVKMLVSSGAPRKCVLATTLQACRLTESFDVVILEGARWLGVEDAVGAIYRGRQLIVVGEDGVDIERAARKGVTHEPGSILEACRAASFPILTLACHYRARHDSLMSFVQQEFYQGTLTVFPAPQPDHPTLGIDFQLVSGGLLSDGRNDPEARRVVELALLQRTQDASKNLGIVALSAEQRQAIEEELDRRLGEQPELQFLVKGQTGEQFFIKDAESLRGDARDAILLSVGFGRDARGRLPAHWDPLGRESGPELLRAASTLARERLTVVSSLIAKDIPGGKHVPAGVTTLGRFLDHVERWKSRSQPVPAKPGADHGPIINDILSELQARGYSAQPRIGLGSFHIDVAVIDPDDPRRYLLAILLDGPEYAAVPTASERDQIHPEVLERLGWKLHRIWAPEWTRRRAEEIELLGAILAALA